MLINRRVFLAVTGAAAAVSAARWTIRAPKPAAAAPAGISFYAEDRGGPAGRPRTAAIIYLPAEEKP